MVDKIGFFTKNAYVFWADCNKSVCRLKRGLDGRQLRFAPNQQTNANGLIKKYPAVFNTTDTYELVGGKYLGKGEYTNPSIHTPTIYQKTHDGEPNDYSGRVIQMVLKNQQTGKTAQLDPTWLVSFNIVGTTLKEKMATKLAAIKSLFN